MNQPKLPTGLESREDPIDERSIDWLASGNDLTQPANLPIELESCEDPLYNRLVGIGKAIISQRRRCHPTHRLSLEA